MTQEDKDLLLKDLCGRLPYGIKGNYQNSNDELLRKVTIGYRYLEPNGMVMTGDIKPYLFPLSSMTDEQLREFIILYNQTSGDNFCNANAAKYIDWLNENYFDYRGLIKQGLALDATGLNIY